MDRKKTLMVTFITFLVLFVVSFLRAYKSGSFLDILISAFLWLGIAPALTYYLWYRPGKMT